jgi:hypothetical protein
MLPSKTNIQNDRAIKIFHDKQKLKQYMTNNTKDSARNSTHRRGKQTKP